jgi:regulator of cell morphogenesis and NO signaling
MNAIHELPSTHSWDHLAKLIDTVSYLHHPVLRQKLDFLNRLIQRIAQNHVVPLTVMDRFERQFLAMADHLETNMEEQECWLFAWLRRIFKRGFAIGQDNYLELRLAEAMAQAVAANQEALDTLGQIQICLCGHECMNKGILVGELIDHLRDLKEVQAEYDHLEREELFPRVRKLCQTYMKGEEINHAF